MKQIHSDLSRIFLFCTLSIMVFSGCRTYGGYDSEEAIYNQIVEINGVFANELEKAKGNLSRLEQAAKQKASLEEFVHEYEDLLAHHEHMIHEHAELTESLEIKTGFVGQLTPAYRNLNRALGYIAAEQSAMRNGYYRFAAHLGGDHQETDWSTGVENSRYQAVPPFYHEVHHAIERKTVSACSGTSYVVMNPHSIQFKI